MPPCPQGLLSAPNLEVLPVDTEIADLWKSNEAKAIRTGAREARADRRANGSGLQGQSERFHPLANTRAHARTRTPLRQPLARDAPLSRVAQRPRFAMGGLPDAQSPCAGRVYARWPGTRRTLVAY